MKEKYDVKAIKEHYKNMAEKWKTEGKSTMEDMNTRRLEIEAVLKYLKDGQKVLETGCGNGYATVRILENKKIDLTSMDFSEHLIEQAKKQDLGKIIGKAKFELGDVLKLKYKDNSFDNAFSIRCLINITDWEYQKKALDEICRVLKKGGHYIMCESFIDGWSNMNEARKELGLKEITQPFHNLYFDKEKVAGHLNRKMQLINEDNFLSSYYFGARVMYPALLGKNKEPRFDSKINTFFAAMPAYGNHGTIKILVLKKL